MTLLITFLFHRRRKRAIKEHSYRKLKTSLQSHLLSEWWRILHHNSSWHCADVGVQSCYHRDRSITRPKHITWLMIVLKHHLTKASELLAPFMKICRNECVIFWAWTRRDVVWFYINTTFLSSAVDFLFFVRTVSAPLQLMFGESYPVESNSTECLPVMSNKFVDDCKGFWTFLQREYFICTCGLISSGVQIHTNNVKNVNTGCINI